VCCDGESGDGRLGERVAEEGCVWALVNGGLREESFVSKFSRFFHFGLRFHWFCRSWFSL
jgi:hypothetical protein